MKRLFKNIIVSILRFETKLILQKYQPEIIAVTGSVGKTSAKDAIFEVIKNQGRVRKSEKSYNSEIGMPLTVIGAQNAWYSPLGWFSILLRGALLLVSHDRQYPHTLVVEAGADKPGDIGIFVQSVKPDIAVVTAVGEVPVHVEFFSGAEEVAREKAKLLAPLTSTDTAILNYDDAVVCDMKEKTRGHVITFGFGDGAYVRAEHYHIMYRKEGDRDIPEGIAFKVAYKGNNLPLRIFDTFGKHQVYAVLAAISVGIAKDINLIDVVSALQRYSSPPGRLKLIKGEKNTFILDDTYNASPHAMHAALEVVRDIPAKRKIAVLGDMLELGRFTEQAHRAVAEYLTDTDVLITVGVRAKFIADEARATGFDAKHIFEFDIAIDAGKKLEEILTEGDLVLVKGSQSMRMERVVEEIMAEPERAGELLVRQDKVWKNKK
ncbi:MAG: UDP-N-acetylmuramoyl-tripeptide--D-alanyl-D-alanine ligase [bacterium]|nr:UDP-N-acetylmuramoyl-tripeptide--D-alanyl-D-alanine ligase [bacterium]